MSRKKSRNFEDENIRYVPQSSGQKCLACGVGIMIDHIGVDVDDRGELVRMVWATNSGRTISTVRYTTCSNPACGSMYRGLTTRRAEDAQRLFQDLQHARHKRKPWRTKGKS